MSNVAQISIAGTIEEGGEEGDACGEENRWRSRESGEGEALEGIIS